MDKEIASMHSQKVWTVVPTPPNKNIVGSRWLFRLKRNEYGEISRYKARLVAQGFSQQPGVDYDEVYAPVVRLDSLRLLLSLAAYYQWQVIQLDVEAAFLYGTQIYMRLPDGYSSYIDSSAASPATSAPTGTTATPNISYCAKLNKSIYGLKQAPREWHAHLTSFFISIGYTRCHFDPCVFFHRDKQLIMAVYVDDICAYGPNSHHLDDLLATLKQEFQLSAIGNIHWLLGIQILRNPASITLSQSSYIDQILQGFGMTDCNPVNLPMELKNQVRKFQDGDEITDVTLYQQISCWEGVSFSVGFSA